MENEEGRGQPEDTAAVNSNSVPNLNVKTLYELSTEVNSWCLLSDNELQRYLRKFSTEIFIKTKKVQDSLEGLIQETSCAEVRLNNAFNQFLMLSNTQFIENRVYDEEETAHVLEEEEEKQATEDGEKEEESTPEPTPAVTTVVEKYRSALDFGFQAMKLFAMVDDDDSDQEQPQDTDDALDIYNERPLPFIIGTRDFLEDETLGLGAAPESDDEDEYDSSEASSHESDSEASGSDNDSFFSGSESEASEASEDDAEEAPRRPPPLPKPPVPKFASSDGEDESSEESGSESESSEEEEGHRRAPPPTPDLFGQAAPRTPGAASVASVPWSDEDEDEDLFAYRPATLDEKLKKQDSFQGLFGEDNAEDSDKESKGDLFAAEDMDDGLFAAPSTVPVSPRRSSTLQHQQSARSTGNALFGDDDSDNESTTSGLFGQSRQSMLPIPQMPTEEARESSLFGDSSTAYEEKQNETTPDSTQAELAKALATRAKQRNSGLFDSDSDKESTTSGLFGASSTAAKAPIVQKSNSGLFGDDDDVSDEDEIPMPRQSSGLFGDDEPSAVIQKKESALFDESDESDHGRGSADSGLFGSSAVEKEGSTLFKENDAKPTIVEKQGSALFGDDESDESDHDGRSSAESGLFGSAAVEKQGSALFGNDESDESDHGRVSEKSAAAVQKQGSTLFGEESDDEKAKQGSGLFDSPMRRESSVKSQVDLFGTPPRQSQASEAGLFDSPAVPSSQQPASTLFDSPEPAATSSLFGSPQQGLEKQSSSSLFESPNLTQQDSSKSVDGGLFGREASIKSQAGGLFDSPPPEQAPSSGGGLFDGGSDDESDDGLFGAASTTSKPSPPVAAAAVVSKPIIAPPPMSMAHLHAAQGDGASDSDNDWSDEDDDDNTSLFGTSTKK